MAQKFHKEILTKLIWPMKIENIPFIHHDWSVIPKEEYRGEKGTSYWQVCETEDIRIRIVEYSASFKADHWCPRGHFLYILYGEMQIEFKNKNCYTISQGESFIIGDDEQNPHMVTSSEGARVLIVD